ncbi:fasciclin-like arabinogalactan protein 17 [Nymphaea colorata]|uniref:fasciclin-like arabinogalactan protein 17 n=1 Tax=Nymphaea colorata TaxID=210225 RepID=UPI00129D6228|nr:fasciclin-like arabinogalactan protein 17 [Nymphaea colorata]
MDPEKVYGFKLLILPLLLLLLGNAALEAAASPPTATSAGGTPVNSNSVLVALLDSRYTELAELVEKALLLQTLEEALGKHNVTIFAPRNEALERDLDPEFRRFLLEPGNLHSLQSLLMFHVVPQRILSGDWPHNDLSPRRTLSLAVRDDLRLSHRADGTKKVDSATVVHLDDIIRPDGVIHGIERLLVPRSVQDAFNRRRNLAAISAVLPKGAPEVDTSTMKLKKKPAKPDQYGYSPPPYTPSTPIYEAVGSAPASAPAPAPGPSSGHRWFDGESQVKDFIHTLLHYGGFNELADILVNLTSLATEMGRLVSEGYVLTVLAPNDEAMARLTTEQLSEPGAPEQIIYYHFIPEYQTEESMYNAVRRFGKVRYDTLRLPYKVTAQEADGSVRFGHGDGAAYLIDPDIYVDGRISVQGVDKVLFPSDAKGSSTTHSPATVKTAKSPASGPAAARRGKLVELTCKVLSMIRQDSRLSTCQRT